MMTPEQIHAHITPLLLARLDANRSGRGEALRAFMALNFPALDRESARKISGLIPELPRELYRKWITMFIDRLLATIPQNQLGELCNGSPDNNAALGMIYLMFMESERMEKQVAANLAELAAVTGREDLARLVAHASVRPNCTKKSGN